MQGAKLTCPLRDPEGLQQWLETEMFMKTLWQWHKADVNIEGDIVPAKVLQVFRTLVENAVRTCHLSGEPVRSREGERGVITSHHLHCGDGRVMGGGRGTSLVMKCPGQGFILRSLRDLEITTLTNTPQAVGLVLSPKLIILI